MLYSDRIIDEEPVIPVLNVSIASPVNGAVLSGNSPAVMVTVTGKVTTSYATAKEVYVQLGAGAAWKLAQKSSTGSWSPWSFTGPVSTPGSLKISAKVIGHSNELGGLLDELEDVVSVTVQVNITDVTLPELTITAPQNGAVVWSTDGRVTKVPVTIQAADQLSGVASITWNLDGVDVLTEPFTVPAKMWSGTKEIEIKAKPPGSRIIKVRCRDQAGNQIERSVTVKEEDRVAPFYEIIEPQDLAKLPAKEITLRGTAQDLQSGMAAVEYSFDGGPAVQVQTGDNWANWHAVIPTPSPGLHTIKVRFKDKAGNAAERTIKVEVATAYKPRSAEDLLSERAYLEDLIGFAGSHVAAAPAAKLRVEDLRDIFHQPFDRLIDPLLPMADEPVNQLRGVVEVLRRYRADVQPAPIAYWKCDEGSGTTATDSRGGLKAVLSGATWGSGKYGKALAFDGVDDFARVDPAPVLEVGKNGADFSVAFWIYLRQGGSGPWRSILHKGAVDAQRTFALWLHPSSNHIHYRISTATNPNDGGDSKAQVPLKTWTHIAYVKSKNVLQLYINGRLDAQTVLSSPCSSNTGPLYIGKDPWHGGVNALLEEIRIYDRALSPDAVLAHLVDPAVLAKAAAGLPAAEARYAEAAYQALLHRIGTSYEEIRMARGADEPTRRALAERLGISLGPTRPDQLDALFLAPGQITEGTLETLFGLVNTTRDPFQAGPAPRLQVWRQEHIRKRWWEEDHPAGEEAAGRLPLIDPDRVGKEDFQNAAQGNPAYDLWNSRSAWLGTTLAGLKQQRAAQATPLKGFDTVVSGALGIPVADLLALQAQVVQGINITASLEGLGLSLPAFKRLIRVRKLAEAGSVLEGEWEDVYHILVQVLKRRKYAEWREQERLDQIALTPDHFKQADRPVALSAWRAGREDRQAWEDTLAARTEQMHAVVESLRASVAAAEEMTLRLLRDALVAALGTRQGVTDMAEWLSERLLIDVEGNGSQRTNRLLQAMETLQGILFSLRTGRFDEDHPADAWQMTVAESDFDEEWRWMSTLATWRAAMLVFFYPENLLLPNLRKAEDQTKPFLSLVAALRNEQRLSPQKARDLAKDYLAAVRTGPTVLPNDFVLTDQLSEADIRSRKALSKNLLDPHRDTTPPPYLSEAAPDYLTEAFYFVPMQIALQLQKSGEYVAALDWYQTVYAYNLPVPERKIYYGLALEGNRSPDLSRVAQWLIDWMNPHTIAAQRPNPYTRYTLMCIARCFMEFADSEFTRDTGDSIARARSLYATARQLLHLPELATPAPASASDPVLPNPVLEALRLRVEIQLDKLRQGRNIAGMKRQVEPPVPAAQAAKALPTVGGGGQLVIRGAASVLRPTPYRYQVLLERSKQLAGLAQQMEAAYLSALEKRDAENYNLIQAGHQLELAGASVELQNLRVTEARHGVALSEKQRDRTVVLQERYQQWIEAGLNSWEQSLIDDYERAREVKDRQAGYDYMITSAQAMVQAAASQFAAPLAFASAALATVGAFNRASATMELNAIEASTQTASLRASHERRKQEWELQKSLADQDLLIGEQQILLAQDREAIARKEAETAQVQVFQAKAVADFLANKFTNADLYEWMSGVLAGVYGYFLQQATATAQLAQNQLAFERHEMPPGFIRADYWQAPSDAPASRDGQAPDRRGLTGSARLLQDIHQLDQYAFESDKRKLNLTQTFSLSQLAPYEFQQFRDTGVLPFVTPMVLFDRAFPGHYLRLVKRVRTSVVALIPPTQGIRATLTASGISRVVTGGDVFQEVVVRRDPEVVALTSPVNATGIFELDVQADMLLPFEGMGVDTTWELQMPRASNPFDYSTIADVLVTIEYTALHSFEYRQQVVQRLDRKVSSDRAFSLRQRFADAWYDLHNPEQVQPERQMVVTFNTERADFPPNLEALKIQHVLLYFARKSGSSFEVPVGHLTITEQGGSTGHGGGAVSVDGVISTRRGNAGAWTSMQGRKPVGQWELSLRSNDPDRDRELRERFKNEEIEDILLVLTYSGQTPAWPA